MRKMSIVKKLIASILAVTVTIHTPLSTLAASSDVMAEQVEVVAEGTDEVAVLDDTLDISSMEADDTSDDIIVSENTVVAEITELRDENVKAFYMSDHSVKVCYYPDSIHYKNEDGGWSDIDNRLCLSNEGDFTDYAGYTNVSAAYKVKFAANADENRLFDIGDADDRVSFSYVKADSVSNVSQMRMSCAAKVTSDDTEEMSLHSSATDDNSDDDERIPVADLPSVNRSDDVWYEDIEENVSLKYSLLSDGVKESIYIKSKDASNKYSFKINTTSLSVILNEDKSVSFLDDNKEEKYIIPAPVVVDAAGDKDEEAFYTYEKSDDTSGVLTLNVSEDWLYSSDRKFPVDADPTIEIYRKNDKLDTLGTFVTVGSDKSKSTEKFKTGVNKNGIHYRTYMQLNIPEIPKGSVITDARLNLRSTGVLIGERYYYAVNLKEKFNKDELTWDKQPLGNKKEVKLSEVDLIDCGNKDAEELDITSAVKEWVKSEESNTGLCLVMSNETDAGIEKEGEVTTGVRDIEIKKSIENPFCEITYKDFTGLEDYWSSHSQSAGNAGTTYINDYTGKLTYVHQDAASAGVRMPLSVTHVYDEAFGERYADDKWDASGDKPYGKHFRLSSDVRLLIPSGEANVEDYPYVYIDSDGTKHYFKKANVSYYVNGGIAAAYKTDKNYPSAKDEDGLGLFVVPVKDKKLNGEDSNDGEPKYKCPLKIVDKTSSISMYFDEYGYLKLITDSNQREDGKNAADKERNYTEYEHIRSTADTIDTEEDKKRVENLQTLINTLEKNKDTKDALKANAANIRVCIRDLQKDVKLFSVNYEAAASLQKIDGLMQDISTEIGSTVNNINAAKSKVAKLIECDFDVPLYITTAISNASGQEIKLTYDDNGYLKAMTDPSCGGKEIKYSYEDGLLTKIEHPCNTKAELVYNNNYLSAIMDENGNTLVYEYDSKGKVSKISEYTTGKSEACVKNLRKSAKKELSTKQLKSAGNKKLIPQGTKAGQSISISYDEYNQCAYTYSGADDKLGTKDDIENVYCFDEQGRCINVYTKDKSTKKVKGAGLYTYTKDSEEKNDANKIKETAVLGRQVENYVSDSGFEEGDLKKWKITDKNGKCEIVSTEKYQGHKSAYLKLDNKAHIDNSPKLMQDICVPFSGECTLSAYVKTKDMRGANAYVSLKTKKTSSQSRPVNEDTLEGVLLAEDAEENPDDDILEDIEEEPAVDIVDENTPSVISDGYRRLQTKIKVKKGDVVTVTLGLYGDAGQAYFDCVQLEKGGIANQYNFVSNGSFEKDLKSGDTPEGFSYSFPTEEVTFVTDKNVIEGSKAICIKGDETKKKIITIDPHFGTDNASYTFSCYVKVNCVPQRDNRKVEISVPLLDAVAKINTGVNGWQYVTLALPSRNWSNKKIEIHFDYECGTLCIDGCMLTRNGVDVYTYTDAGVISSAKGRERVTTYTSNERNETTRMVSPAGAVTSYYYDNVTNDLKKEVHTFAYAGNTKQSNTQYTYDRFGNVSNTTLSWTNGKTLSTDNSYSDDGRFVTKSTDARGNEIGYEYNTDDGTLLSVTDALGKKTSYTYNDYLNPTSVSLSDRKIDFSYDGHNQLSGIKVSDKLGYSFKYDDYRNLKNIKLGKTDLITYGYVNGNGKLNSVKYANSDTAKLTYNDLELIKERNFGSNDKLTFEYDNKGRLARIHDTNTNLTYDLTYDDANRVTCSSISEKNKIKAEFSSNFDVAGRQSVFSYVYDGTSFKNEYAYTTDDRITLAKLSSGGQLNRTYDNIGRTKSETFVPSKNKATGVSERKTTGKSITSSLSYVETDRAGNEGTDTKYKYTTKLLGKLDIKIDKDNVLSDTLSYDKVGRVSKYNNCVYTYDDFSRLVKAKDEKTGNEWEYTYDDLGNILKTTSKIAGKESVQEYKYNPKSPTFLESVKGSEGELKIAGYKGGNPKTYGSYALDYKRGYELRNITNKNKNDTFKKIDFTYSHEGIRLSKTVDNKKIEYVLNGSTILAQKSGEGSNKETLNFYYSPEGKLLQIGYLKGSDRSKENYYSIIKNAMGDVASIYTADGILVGSYEYDPYGKIIAVNHNEKYEDTDDILNKNPFRYRGYYYDEETRWYYLNSRFYDPEVKRFINADSAIEANITNQCVNFNQYNLFAYCNDNPVNKSDEGGNLENWQKVAIGAGVIALVGIVTIATAGTGTALACFAAGAFEGAVGGAASGAVMGAATGAISSRITTGSWEGAGQAALDGAASGFMTGAISGAITGGITSNHCFVAGTLIVTATGYEAIENIRPGDKVYAVDSDTGEVALKSVAQTYVNDADELVHLQLNTKDSTDEELVTTPGHPFFIYGKGYEFAGNLRAGDILVNLNGEKVVLEKVQHEILESPVKVYNFEVEDYHTYFVGKEEVWVHNMCQTQTKNFKNKQVLEDHFSKHGDEIAQLLEEPNYTVDMYLKDANHIINNGTHVPELNGYVRFMKGDKFGFVGMNSTTGDITTFHVKSIGELIKKAPSLGFGK